VNPRASTLRAELEALSCTPHTAPRPPPSGRPRPRTHWRNTWSRTLSLCSYQPQGSKREQAVIVAGVGVPAGPSGCPG